METVRFTTRPDGYGCNKPGDMSGDYVRAEVARELLAVAEAVFRDSNGRFHSFYCESKAGGVCQCAIGLARAALAKARGQ